MTASCQTGSPWTPSVTAAMANGFLAVTPPSCRGRSVAVSTPTLLPQGQHELRRDKPRKEQHRRVTQRVSTRVSWSGSASLINRPKATRGPNSREPAFEKCKTPDFQADPRPSHYFSSSLRPPKLRSFVPAMMSIKSKALIPQEPSQAPDRACMPHRR